MSHAPQVIRLRRALRLVIAGLALQLFGAFHWTPGTFVLAAALGLPLVLVGVVSGGLAAFRSPSTDSEPRS